MEQNLKENPEEKGNAFRVILLGIIFNPETRKILIGRRENDPNVPQLTWVFPGGEAEYDEQLEETLSREIKEETGLDVEILGSVFSKIFPEKKDFIIIYYLCEATGGKEQAGDEFKEIKWVAPEQLEQLFTTSFHPTLKEYIMNLGSTNSQE